MNKNVVFWLWVAVIASALYFYFFRNDLIRVGILRLMDLPLSWRYTIFLIFGCLRGFTLIPITYLILLGLVFFADHTGLYPDNDWGDDFFGLRLLFCRVSGIGQLF